MVASYGDDAESPVSVFRDGIFTQGVAEQDYGVLSQPYHDGVFSSPLGAAGPAPIYDLTDPTLLSEVKRALATFGGGAGNFDNGSWEQATEEAWRRFVAGMAASGATGAGTYTAQVAGHDYPTAEGLVALAAAATLNYDRTNPANGAAYGQKYWPNLLAFAQKYAEAGNHGSVSVSSSGGGPGMSTAAMAALGFGAAVVVFGGLWLMRKKSRA